MSEAKRYQLYPSLRPEVIAFLPDMVVSAADYDHLEQELERQSVITGDYIAKCQFLQNERNTALNQATTLRELLTRCKEHLEPHRDAALWSDVCAALGPKP